MYSCTTVLKMIQYFVADGHFCYAIESHIYVKEIYSVSNKMTKVEFHRYATGYFTIRRPSKFCIDPSRDMVTKQAGNREFKVVEGIVQMGFINDILTHIF